jgi:pimeloyl-ACP methyl ester carboxylesterase
MSYIETGKDSSGNPVQIHYTDYGTGKPVILIHGWPLSGAMWEYQLTDLVSNGNRVIAYDRRGFGKSSQPWEGYDYDTLSDDLYALIEQLKLEDVTMVGFSMGGGEVVRYFSRHKGKNVSKVVLISSITPYMLQTESNPEGVIQSVFDEMTGAIKEDRIAFLDNFGKDFFGANLLHKPLSTPLLDYYRNLCADASPRATLQCALAFSSTDFRDEMQTVNVPVLIIHGDSDKTIPIDATGKKAAAAIEGNCFIIYEGAPHGLFYTDRKKLNTDLVSFLNDQDPAVNHEETRVVLEVPQFF